MSKKIPYCSLHTHSDASLLDAIQTPEEIVKKAVLYGHPAVAITNHGNIYDSVEFYEEAKKAGIKSILGEEFYYVDDVAVKEETSKERYHLTVLASNDVGWRNLKLLASYSNSVGFYKRPRIDRAGLEKYNDGLIVLTGCLSSKIQQLLCKGEAKLAEDWLLYLKSLFGDRLYVELQDGEIAIQKSIKVALRELATKHKIERVVTQDAHYSNPEDALAHEVICAMESRATLNDPLHDDVEKEKGAKSRKRFSTDEFWFKDSQHFADLFEEDEIRTSVKIAERCDVNIELGKLKLPHYDFVPPKYSNSFEFMRQLCRDGYIERNLPNKDATYIDRIKKELGDIKTANLADYFLILNDWVSWSKQNNIPVLPGRGSASGSLTSYLLKITDIDPVKYDLIWERFYNVGRKSMPDIDIDVCEERRQEIITYIKNRFGVDRVLPVITFNTFGVRAAIREAARVMGYPVRDIEVATKWIPHKGVDSVEDASNSVAQISSVMNKYPKLLDVAKRIQGKKFARGTHAAALVLLDEPVSTGCIPVCYDSSKKKQFLTGFDMYTIDRLGYLKMDLLGLKTATILQECLNLIGNK